MEGLSVILWGTVLLALRGIIQTLWEQLTGLFITSIEVSERDAPEVYRWIGDWFSGDEVGTSLSRLHAVADSPISSGLQKKMLKKIQKNLSPSFQGNSLLRRKKSLTFLPGTGTHIILYKKRVLIVSFRKERDSLLGSENLPNQTVTLYTFCFPSFSSASTKFLKEILITARDIAFQMENSDVGVFLPDSRRIIWRRALSLPKLPFSSIVLPDDIAFRILNDCKKFLGSKDWYNFFFLFLLFFSFFFSFFFLLILFSYYFSFFLLLLLILFLFF